MAPLESTGAPRPTTVIFGCGYTGARLARALLAGGEAVLACARHLEQLAPLAALGAELRPIDATRPKQFGPALRGTIAPTVIYSIPPPPGMPGGEAVRRAAQAALAAGARSFVYLGTTGVYGNTPDAEWVDEETSIALGDVDMAPRHHDESAVESASLSSSSLGDGGVSACVVGVFSTMSFPSPERGKAMVTYPVELETKE